MFVITKIQKLSAIHNLLLVFLTNHLVVCDYKDTKIVSNSQLHFLTLCQSRCCLWLQRYKNCQQFTTNLCSLILNVELFVITKIQKLSAIHNSIAIYLISSLVVCDYKDTKIVSNSQLLFILTKIFLSCLWLQRYKNCQQFTTILHLI